jgi:hypothetical protein
MPCKDQGRRRLPCESGAGQSALPIPRWAVDRAADRGRAIPYRGGAAASVARVPCQQAHQLSTPTGSDLGEPVGASSLIMATAPASRLKKRIQRVPKPSDIAIQLRCGDMKDCVIPIAQYEPGW